VTLYKLTHRLGFESKTAVKRNQKSGKFIYRENKSAS